MSAETRTALLDRQFMKSLPLTIHLCLLESNQTPSLSDMHTFIQCYYAVNDLRDDNTVIATVENPVSAQQEELHKSICSLTAAVAALSTEQQQIKSALKQPPPSPLGVEATESLFQWLLF